MNPTALIFRFGFESPDELATNERDGTDFESSHFFVIHSPSADAAQGWGCLLADWHVQRLFGDAEPGRWRAGNFAAWIEQEPDPALLAATATAQVVTVGEFPARALS